MKEVYNLFLSKSEVVKLYLLSKENKDKVPKNVRDQLFNLYVLANDIKVNGGGA